MNTTKLRCLSCDEPITGEPGTLCAHCGADAECRGCGRGEEWADGCWYLDGEHYTCAGCGAVHLATIDDTRASLELIEQEVERG